MKKLILVASLSLAAHAAHAESGTLMHAPNNGGGLIYLTDSTSKRCTQMRTDSTYIWRYVESTNTNGVILWKGCWRYADSTIHLYWSDDTEVRMPLSQFKFTDYWDRNYGADAPAAPAATGKGTAL